MRPHLLLFAAFLPLCAGAADDITSLHPEGAIPNDLPRLTSPGPFSGTVEDIQRQLVRYGFDPGPANGDFGAKTQAALAQFQLANDLPVSGMPDARTLSALGVPLVDQAMAQGASEGQVASEGSSQPQQ